MSFRNPFARLLAPAAALTLLAASGASAQNASAIDQVEGSLAATQSMTANFTQTDQRNRTLPATLLRTPELLPGDPDAPILPDFDIRIDRFELDNFRVAQGVVALGVRG